MRNVGRIIFKVLLVLLLAFSVHSEVPQLINYQGQTSVDCGGDNLCSITARIYSELTSGTLLWEETYADIPISDQGVFNILLGGGTPGTPHPDFVILFTGDELWLEITVESFTFSPRVALASMPYSFRQETVDGASGGTIYGSMVIDGDYGFNEGYVNIKPINIDRGGQITLGNSSGIETVHLDAESIYDSPYLSLYNELGSHNLEISARGPANGDYGGMIRLFRPDGTDAFELYGNHAYGAELLMYQSTGHPAVTIDTDDGDANLGAALHMHNGDGTRTLKLDADIEGGGAGMWMYNSDYGKVITMAAEDIDLAPIISMNQPNGEPAVIIDGGDGGPNMGSAIHLFNQNGLRTLKIDANSHEGSAGIWVYNSAGTRTVNILGDDGTGYGRVKTEILEITGGGDLSEQFDIVGNTNTDEPIPGMVVSIDPTKPGRLKISSKKYDPTVAGIISGAGDVRPGMLMGQKGTVADGKYPVALTGRVYCYANASFGAIKPGDLLTTSNTPGHAMKVTDYNQANGAIIGKAMTSLDKGQGLVLVLVSLQ